MKTKTMAAALLGLTLTGSAFAAGSTGNTTTSTSNLKNLYQKLKESPASMNVLLDTGFSKNENNEIVSATQTNIAYLGWKLSSKDSLRLENRWTTNFGWDESKTDEENKADTTWSREVIKYTRTGILNQKDNGINLSANMELRILPDAEARGKSNSNGGVRPSVSASHSLSNGINLSGTFYYMRNLRRDDKPSTYTSYNYLVTSQSYGFTEKLSLAFIQEYIRMSKPGTADTAGLHNDEDLTVTAELGYQFNPVVYAGIYAGNTLMASNDGQLFKDEIFPNANWGVNFYISAF